MYYPHEISRADYSNRNASSKYSNLFSQFNNYFLVCLWVHMLELYSYIHATSTLVSHGVYHVDTETLSSGVIRIQHIIGISYLY